MQTDPARPLKQHPQADLPYCCLDCYSKFTVGDLVPSQHGIYGLGCPTCKGGAIHPHGGEMIVLREYHGQIGAIN